MLLGRAAANVVTLEPGVPETAIDHVPEKLRGVARKTAGFVHNSARRRKWIGWEGEIRWDGDLGSDYLQDAGSNAWHMDIGTDGCGNRWVLLLDEPGGSPREVLWASHDAPVTLIAEDSFFEFCKRIIDDTESFLNSIGHREYAIWQSKPLGLAVEAALSSSDRVIRETAKGLDHSWRIFDARPSHPLRGFVRLAPDGILKHSSELVLPLKKNPAPTRAWWKIW